MTVTELIARLQAFPPETRVLTYEDYDMAYLDPDPQLMGWFRHRLTGSEGTSLVIFPENYDKLCDVVMI